LIFVVGIILFFLKKTEVKFILYDDFQEYADVRLLGRFGFGTGEPQHVPLVKYFTITWKNTAIRFDDTLLKRVVSNNNLLLTIETWSKDGILSSSYDNVLQETLDGEYDSRIEALGKILNKSKNIMFVRWNPDMEVPVNRLPWQQQSPLLYIQAFRHFSVKLKNIAPSVKIVWSPTGFPGDTEYFPGTAYVDLAGVTLRSDSELALPNNGLDTVSTEDLLRHKLHRMRFVGRDILILGSRVTAQKDFTSDMLRDVNRFFRAYAHTVYKNDKQKLLDNARPLRRALNVGLYDPKEILVGDPSVSVEHIFIDWGQIEDGTAGNSLKEISARNHSAIVTVEPWRDRSGVPDSNVLKSMLNGRYDMQIIKLQKMLKNLNQVVYLRFAHEMEIPIHRYAWQSQDPVTYINSYRYFMKFFDSGNLNIRKVWGPAGDRGSLDFWPGDDVVDYISVAIYGLPDKNISDHKKQERFEEIFNRKIYRMRFTAKPIFITEFGVKGPESFQSAWLQAAAETIKANSFVFGVCYFNLYDNPKVWGKGMEAPDWSISKETFDAFCKSLGEDVVTGKYETKRDK
jgi:beta-mannanase